MPKLNFPASPSPGTLYTENGNTWKWNGTSWISFNSLDLTSQVSGALGITYGGTGYSSNSKGDILVGTGQSWYKLSYSASANDVLTVDTSQPSGLKWAAVPPASASSVQVSSTNQNLVHYPTFVDNLNGSGLALSTDSSLFYNPSTNLLNLGGLGVSGNAYLVGTLSIYESTGSSYVGFRASNLIGSTIYTLPTSSPATGSSVLQSSSEGILSWVPMVATGGGGAGTVDQGEQYSVAFYPQAGTAVTGNSNLKYNSNLLDTLTLGGMTFVGSGNSAIQITNVPNGGQILTTWSTLNSGLSLDDLNASLRIVGDTNAGTTLVDFGVYSNSGFPVGTWTSKYLFPKTSEAIFVNGLKITELTNSTGATSGALKVEGGVGVSGNAFIGGTISAPLFTGNVSATAVTASNFYGDLTGFATTAQNINIVNASGITTNYLLMTPTPGTVSGGAVSSITTITINPSTSSMSLDTGSLTANGIIVGSNTNTVNTISGNLTIDSAGGTVNLNDNLIVQGNLTVNGTTTAIDSTITTFLDPVIVLGSGAGNTHSTIDDNKDRGIEFRYADSGTAITGFFGYKDDKKFYYIPNANITSDGVYSGIAGTIVSNLEGIATTSQNVFINSASENSIHRLIFTPNNTSSGSALSTNSTLVYNPFSDILTVSGMAVTSSVGSTSTSTGALIVTGGVGIGGSLNVTNSSHISGVAISGGAIYGNLIGTATTAQNIHVRSASSNSEHFVLFTSNNNASGAAISTNSTLVYNPSTDKLTVSGMAITSSTISTSTTTGALVVTGGVGIGDGLYTSTNNLSSISGVAISNSVIKSGTWAGSIITAFYGGTGTGLYAKGDLLVGDFQGHISRFPVDGDGAVLIGSSYSGYGISWQPLLSPTYGAFASTTTQSVTASGSTVIHFNTTYEANRVSITPSPGTGNTTRIYIQDTGTYNLHYSLQNNLLTTNQPRQGDFYFRINGVDVPLSNTRITVTGSAEETVLSLNLTKTIVGGSYVELVMQSSTSDFAISNFTGLTTPTRPDIPSAIFSVYPVTSVVPGGGAGISGIASLNNETGSIQTFATGSFGSDFNIVSLNNVHTFNIPNAGITTDRGLITNSTQSIAGLKTFTNILTVSDITTSTSPITGSIVNYGGLGVSGSASIGGSLLLFNSLQDNYVGFVVGSLTGSTTYVLPTQTPQSALGTSVLSSTIDGIMSWIPGGGTVDSGLLYQVPYYYAGNAITGSSGLINVAGSGVTVTYTADSTSQSTGAFVVSGGVGIGGSLNLGNRLSLYNGANYITFLNSGSASTIYTLPSNSPQGSGTSVLSSTQDGVMSWVPMTVTSSSGGTVNTGVASRLAYYQSSGAAVTDTYGINYNNSGTASTFTIFGGASLGNTVFIVQALSTTSVKVGIGLTNPAYELEVNGEISATSKSFVIDHPTKSGMKLRYGSLEGPENGVYIRGILYNENIIETPDYWRGLVDHDTFTVNLTPIGNYQQLYVEKIEDFKVHVGSAGSVHCYYYVLAERKDVDKLIVEY